MKLFKSDSKCPKCGTGTAKYAIEHGATWRTSRSQFNDLSYDIIERKCRFCGYEWKELPLDTTEKTHEDSSRFRQ